MSFMRAMLYFLALATVILPSHPAAAAPVGVRFVEGSLHGFIVLRTLDGVLIASGDLLQTRRGCEATGCCSAARHSPRTPKSPWSEPPASTV